MKRFLFALAFALAAALPAFAVEPDEMLADPALEARARDLSAGLRCLVCQNQSIDESDAPLARDLRLLLRERLKSGDSDAAVQTFLVARYGDFILLKPRLKTRTILLWATPVAVLAIGVGLVLLARRRQPSEPASLSAAEEAGLRRLLKPESTPEKAP